MEQVLDVCMIIMIIYLKRLNVIRQCIALALVLVHYLYVHIDTRFIDDSCIYGPTRSYIIVVVIVIIIRTHT